MGRWGVGADVTRRAVISGWRVWVSAAWLAGGGCGRTPVDVFTVECEDGSIPSLACAQVDPCAEEVFEIGAEPPKVLLQVDRSCSMQARWSVAVTALRDVLDARGPEVDWGLSMFPDRELDQCMQGEILIPVGTGHHRVVRDFLLDSLDPRHEAYPNGPCLTNINSAIGQTGTDPAFRDRSAARIVLLITDGWDTCGGQDSADGAVELVRRLHDERGIKTYVISFGAGVSTRVLGELAMAGGTAKTDGTPYYQASGADLATIVDEIVGGLRCSYAIDIAPEDLGRLEVVLDGTQSLPRDSVSGWTYDTTTKTLRLNGTACEHATSSAVSVQFDLHCG